MTGFDRQICPIHSINLMPVHHTAHDIEYGKLGKNGKRPFRRIRKFSIARQCPTCFHTYFAKEDTYTGFTYFGDYGDDYRSGIIATEGFSIRNANLSLGIDYESAGISLRAYNIDDHAGAMRKFYPSKENDEPIPGWNDSFRFEHWLLYKNPNIPELLNINQAIRIIRLSEFSSDTTSLIKLLSDCR